MRKLIIAILFAALPGLVLASEGGPELPKAPIDLHDKASLQRGAKLFVNYCLSCHSAKYVRYNRVGRDLGLTDEQVKQNLILTGAKVGDTMEVAMPAEGAKKWFGNPPPDLSVMARARGADYIYAYLKGFYIDPKRPFGVNNAVFKDVGMPDILWQLEGLKKPVYKTVEHEGEKQEVLTGFEPATKGTMTPAEFDKAAADLTNFLVYMSEPVQTLRLRLGWYVLGFLAVLLVVAYLLKKEYWRDVH